MSAKIDGDEDRQVQVKDTYEAFDTGRQTFEDDSVVGTYQNNRYNEGVD
jgi:hypothetical protein